MRSQIKSIRPKLSRMYIVNMDLVWTHEETSFVSLDGLDNISILLDKDNDLEEEITYSYNKVSLFIFKFEKKTQLIRF